MEKEHKLENSFWKIALVFGILIALLMPIMQIQDEDTHTMRSVNMAYLNFFDYKEGFDIPYSIYSYIGNYTENQGVYVFENNPEYRINWKVFKEAAKIPLDDSNRVFFRDGDENSLRTGLYGNLSYCVQGLGILVGRIFHLPIYWTLILGRFTKLIFYIVLIYWAIKIIPVGKEVVFVIALLPNNIQYAASLSPDGVLTSCSLLFVAYILYLKNRDDVVQKKDWVILLILIAFIFNVKYIYSIQGLLILTIPKEKLFPNITIPKLSKKQKIGFACFFVILVGVGYGVAYQMSGALGECARHPINFLLSVFNTIQIRANFLAVSLVANFGTGPVNLPYIVSYGILMFAIFSSYLQIGNASDKEEVKSISYKDIVIFILATILIVTTIFMAGILIGAATLADGATLCSGLLGRYFVVPLSLTLILCRKIGFRVKVNYYLVNSLIIAYMTYSCYFIANRYWL